MQPKDLHSKDSPAERMRAYGTLARDVIAATDLSGVEALTRELADCWQTGRQVFLCGNGGSGANAVHIANDFLYAMSKTPGSGLRVHALPANASVMTCLANDEGYDTGILAAACGAGAPRRCADRAVRQRQFAEHPQGA